MAERVSANPFAASALVIVIVISVEPFALKSFEMSASLSSRASAAGEISVRCATRVVLPPNRGRAHGAAHHCLRSFHYLLFNQAPSVLVSALLWRELRHKAPLGRGSFQPFVFSVITAPPTLRRLFYNS